MCVRVVETKPAQTTEASLVGTYPLSCTGNCRIVGGRYLDLCSNEMTQCRLSGWECVSLISMCSLILQSVKLIFYFLCVCYLCPLETYKSFFFFSILLALTDVTIRSSCGYLLPNEQRLSCLESFWGL